MKLVDANRKITYQKMSHHIKQSMHMQPLQLYNIITMKKEKKLNWKIKILTDLQSCGGQILSNVPGTFNLAYTTDTSATLHEQDNKGVLFP